jgi:hypothetical protein
VTSEQLERAEDAYRRAAAAYEQARAARNAAVREALSEGWTHARVAEATGLTRGRVGQLASFKRVA